MRKELQTTEAEATDPSDDNFAVGLFSGQASSALSLANDALEDEDFPMAYDQATQAVTALEEILRLRGLFTEPEPAAEKKPWNAGEDIDV